MDHVAPRGPVRPEIRERRRKKFEEGNWVRVREAFETNNKRSVWIHKGVEGVIKTIKDSNGSAYIMFDNVDKDQWVSKRNLTNMVIIETFDTSDETQSEGTNLFMCIIAFLAICVLLFVGYKLVFK